MKHPLLDGTYPFPEGDPKPESETPEAVHAQLARKGPNFRGRIRDVIKALRGENEKTVDQAVGHLIECCKGEMIFRRVALKEIERLERTLSLAQTEIKDWKIAFDGLIAAAEVKTATINGLQARIAELEKDAARLSWLENHHTLHTQVDILYVVDGYQVTLMHEDGFTTLSPAYEGHDLRAAIDAALKSRA